MEKFQGRQKCEGSLYENVMEAYVRGSVGEITSTNSMVDIYLKASRFIRQDWSWHQENLDMVISEYTCCEQIDWHTTMYCREKLAGNKHTV